MLLLAAMVLMFAEVAAQAANLTAARDTATREGVSFDLTVKDAEIIYAGALVAIDSNGEAVNAIDTNALIVIGCAMETVDNTDDGETIEVRRGVYRWTNGGSLTDANIGAFAYVEDNQTVTTAADADNDIIAGVIVDVDASGVWVDTYAVPAQPAATLTALTTTGAAAIGTTLAVAGVATFDVEAVLNGGADADYMTVDAGAGVDTKTAGTLALGAATATKVELADTGVGVEAQGPLTAKEDILADELDTETATTLLLGKATATKVEIADTGVETEIQGPLDIQEVATFGAIPVVTALINAVGAVTPAPTNAPALVSTEDAAWVKVTISGQVYVIPAYQLND